ncbi:MAG: DUF1801 domain-containing protein [Bacteroidota bacterium]
MLYEVKTPSEYLEAIADDWRKHKLMQVRELIMKNGPDLKEGIRYKMLSYEDHEKAVFNLNAQQAYVSLYVGNVEKVENAKELLKPFSLGKGCIRIKKSIDLSETKLEEFIKQVIEIWKEGGNTDC